MGEPKIDLVAMIRAMLGDVVREVVREELKAANENGGALASHIYLNREEAAKLLRKCPATVTAMVKRGELRAQYVGRELRIAKAEVMRALEGK